MSRSLTTALLTILTTLLSSSLLSSSLLAAEVDLLFRSVEPLAITLNGPFERIDKERDKENEYEGSLSYVDEAGQTVTLDAKYTVRGNYRLRKSNCSYSQLWVNLKRGQVEGTIFAEQNRLKLVVQCRANDRYAEYITKEQQAYTIFSEVSEYHFDTRLVSATYNDSEKSGRTRTHTGFFIEHQNRLADRFEMSRVDLNRVPAGDIEPYQGTLVSLLMYMLGNTDFSLIQGAEGDNCCHNSKLLTNADGRHVSIPYDFDASGYVDASYAPDPQPAFRLRNNRQRLYRGFCVEEATMTAAVEKYLEAQEQIMTIVSDVGNRSQRSVNRSISFMEDFFEVLNDPEELTDEIIEKCRG